ncbi:LysR family transcriptional regulator (plasmid) [Sphingomonas carotinifaciens]|uniref:LysR family transcriptional regulator n=1 Tax=Sphingomonas carotinifaciens TaxID=1166323 RepID=UPI0039A37919
MDWEDLRCFMAVARGGGLSGAARNLGISPQTAGRRIAELETSLGVPLFVRHPSGYRLTDDGLAMLDDAEKVAETMCRLRDNAAARGGDVAGVVRLAAPETLTTNLILPAMCPLLDSYPALTLDVVTGVDTIGIARGEADIALRLVRPDKGALTVREVGLMAHALYAASPSVMDRDYPRLIGWSSAYDLPARHWLRRHFGRDPDILVNSLAGQRAAIEAGMGVGMLPCFLGHGLIEIDTPMRPVEPLWLIAHATDTISTRTRLVYDEVASILATNAAILNPDG